MTINNNVVPAENPLAAAKALSREQLLRLVSDQGRRRLGWLIPRPDITSQISSLTHHMHNIHRELSVTRLVRSMETQLFSRTRMHWAVFRKVVSDDHGKLVESEKWNTVTDYIMVTMTQVHCSVGGKCPQQHQEWLLQTLSSGSEESNQAEIQ